MTRYCTRCRRSKTVAKIPSEQLRRPSAWRHEIQCLQHDNYSPQPRMAINTTAKIETNLCRPTCLNPWDVQGVSAEHEIREIATSRIKKETFYRIETAQGGKRFLHVQIILNNPKRSAISWLYRVHFTHVENSKEWRPQQFLWGPENVIISILQKL